MDALVFEQLKRPRWTKDRFTAKPSPKEVLPQLVVTPGNKVLFRLVDPAGQVIEPDYRLYSGLLRSIIKAWHHARETSEEAFAWGNDGALSEGIDLALHPGLLPFLRHCPVLVDAGMEPIHRAPATSQVVLRADALEGGTFFRTVFVLRGANGESTVLSRPLAVSESALLDKQTLYPVEPMGPAHGAAGLFVDRVPLAQLELFLTLFASNFPALSIEVEGFAGEEGVAEEAKPALIFREVDQDENLLLDASYTVAGLPPAFLRDYDISRMVRLDLVRRTLRECDVEYVAAHLAREELLRDIKRLNRKVSGEKAFFDIDEETGTIILGSDLAREFLGTALVDFASRFTLFGAGKLKRYKIVHAKPKLQVNLSSGIDFLEGDATLEIEGERFSLLDAIAQFRKNAYIQLSDGTQAVIDGDYMARLNRLFKKRKGGVRASFFDLPMIDELMEDASLSAPLAQSREIFRGINSLGENKVPLPRFKGRLRPYQLYGLRWLDYLHTHKLGGCLADDMGLGKTVQAIALFSRIYPKAKKPSLFVMPRSLLFNWVRELENFAPGLSVCQHYGVGRDWAQACQHSIILTTYGTLRSDVETITAQSFHAVLLDESQNIKNSQTQTTQAVCALKAEFRLALSGTPIENNLGELYSLFRFLNPSMFNSRADFDRDYSQPIQKQQDMEAAEELRRKIYPFILRRLKSDVLKELPPKVEQVLFVDMNEEQKAHYEARRRFYQEVIRGEIDRQGLAKSQFAILEALLELRQIATIPEAKTDGRITSSKIERLLEAVDEAVANGHKCLIFTNFLAGVEQVSEAFGEREIGHLTMTGATHDRQSLVERFQSDSRIKAFVMTLKTGGVGLNLTAADSVFILDPWWNTTAESQAVDRAHRIGQQNTVFTYRLIARGTIEEKIQALQSRKKELIDQIVTTDSGALKHLSETDIDSLFHT